MRCALQCPVPWGGRSPGQREGSVQVGECSPGEEEGELQSVLPRGEPGQLRFGLLSDLPLWGCRAPSDVPGPGEVPRSGAPLDRERDMPAHFFFLPSQWGS